MKTKFLFVTILREDDEHGNATVNVLIYSINARYLLLTNRAEWISCKFLDLYSGDTCFESLPVHRLPSLRFVVDIFFSISGKFRVSRLRSVWVYSPF
jgi:hypothetical protein